MNDPLISFLKPLTALGLSRTKREALRTRLALYADIHPLEVTQINSSSPSGIFALIASRHFSVYALSVLVLIGVGATSTLAAEGSVPGETLYALKIHINEPLMTALAPTNVGQARLAARLATRRVDARH